MGRAARAGRHWDYANRLLNPQYMPPAPRKSSPREISGFLGARGQIEFPESMHTDACLGYSAMGYQSWEVARSSLKANKNILSRLAEPVARGHDAKNVLA